MTLLQATEAEHQTAISIENEGVKHLPRQEDSDSPKNESAIDDPDNDSRPHNVQDHVLVVPRKLTKLAQNVLFSRRASPMSYHLEGRWGSRTFQVDSEHMGIPILGPEAIQQLCNKFDDLQQLIHDIPGVKMQYMPYVEPPKHRAREAPYFDATIHPERAPADFDLKKVIEKARQTTGPVVRHTKQPVFTYAELFAGMGGFGVALDALGGRCVFCSELQEHLRDVYRHNFVTVPNRRRKRKATSDEPIEIPIYGDIYQVPDEAFPKNLDLLVGGFPCQPFSSLGEQPGFQCQKSGNLFLEIVRVLNVSRPKAFLLENVPGLRTMPETYDTIVEALEKTGYDVTTEVLSSRGMTATARKRLFFVGLRRDGDQQQQHKFEFPFIPDLQIKARDILDYGEVSKEELEILRLADDTFEQLLASKRWRPNSLAWPNKSIDTVTSHYGNAVGRGETQLVPCAAPEAPRRFSIRELARVMGFPNSYEFLPPEEGRNPMGYRKMHYRMIGNAVCPPLIAVLAGSVLDRCIDVTPGDEKDWVQLGIDIGIALATEATRAEQATVPWGCLVLGEY
ncbi:MAG: hypothetical protein SGILL_002268 [Bacillariaceae sp.]